MIFCFFFWGGWLVTWLEPSDKWTLPGIVIQFRFIAVGHRIHSLVYIAYNQTFFLFFLFSFVCFWPENRFYLGHLSQSMQQCDFYSLDIYSLPNHPPLLNRYIYFIYRLSIAMWLLEKSLFTFIVYSFNNMLRLSNDIYRATGPE